MKLLILFILLFPAICFADMNPYIAGSVVVASGCTRGASFVSEDFSDIANGEEWSFDGNWTEDVASTDEFIGETDRTIDVGNCGQILDNDDNGSNELIFSSLGSSGYVTIEFYFEADTTADQAGRFLLTDGDSSLTSAYRTHLYFSLGNIWIRTSTGSEDTTANYTADTPIKIEIQVNLAQSNGIEAITLWIDGTEYGPYDTYADQNPGSGIDRIVFQTYTTFDDVWFIDSIRGYSGERCVE